MKEEIWFPTPIWFDYLDFDFASVRKACLNLKEIGYPNRTRSNVGGWQSKDLNLRKMSEFKIVSKILDSKISEVCKKIHPEFKCKLDNVWVNINNKNNYHVGHVHPMTTLSGVLYIQVDDDTGDIVFFDDNTPTKHYPIKVVNGSRFFYKKIEYKPKNGMILIFPAWLNHEVESSNSDMTRISISFNIKQI